MSGGDSALDALARVTARLAKVEAAARAVVDEDAASVSGEQGLRRTIAELAAALTATDDCPGAWLIFFDDAEVKPEVFTGEGAERAAKARFAAISDNWNAHLFALVGSNTRDAAQANRLQLVDVKPIKIPAEAAEWLGMARCYHYGPCSRGERVEGLDSVRCVSCPMRGRVGVSVRCAVCGRHKKPVGRDSRDNGLCDHECEGYRLDPQPGCLWPGERYHDVFPAGISK